MRSSRRCASTTTRSAFPRCRCYTFITELSSEPAAAETVRATGRVPLHPIVTLMGRLSTVAVVALTAFLAACTSSTQSKTAKPLPVLDLAATPPGWIPVAYGDAQVSVPDDFNVFDLASQCGAVLRPGTVLVGDRSVPNCSPSPVQSKATLLHFHSLVRNLHPGAYEVTGWRGSKDVTVRAGHRVTASFHSVRI